MVIQYSQGQCPACLDQVSLGSKSTLCFTCCTVTCNTCAIYLHKKECPVCKAPFNIPIIEQIRNLSKVILFDIGDNKKGMAHAMLAQIYKLLRDNTARDIHLKKGAYYGNVWCFITIGKNYHENGDLKNAERWYQVPLKMGSSAATWNIALIYMKRGQYKEAKELFQKVNDGESREKIAFINNKLCKPNSIPPLIRSTLI